MALSEREQQVLRDLEAQLNQEDPNLATSMQRAERSLERPVRLSPRHVGAGVAMVLVGLVVVIGGVAVGHGIISIALGVLGFGLAVWGVTVGLTRVDARTGRPARSASSTRGDGSRQGAGAGARKPSFMERQEQRWDRRRDQER